MLYTHTHTHWNTSHRKEWILPFVITWMDLKVKFAQSCLTLWDSMENSPGWNTGRGSFSLLQGIFPTQGSNRGLLHCRWILYQLNYEGSPHKNEGIWGKPSWHIRSIQKCYCTGMGWTNLWVTWLSIHLNGFATGGAPFQTLLGTKVGGWLQGRSFFVFWLPLSPPTDLWVLEGSRLRLHPFPLFSIPSCAHTMSRL